MKKRIFFRKQRQLKIMSRFYNNMLLLIRYATLIMYRKCTLYYLGTNTFDFCNTKINILETLHRRQSKNNNIFWHISCSLDKNTQ